MSSVETWPEEWPHPSQTITVTETEPHSNSPLHPARGVDQWPEAQPDAPEPEAKPAPAHEHEPEHGHAHESRAERRRREREED
jgi:hypothetical protein